MGEMRGHGSATIHILDRTGDTTVTWNQADPKEVEAAMARFDELRASGHTAFKVHGEGGSERIEVFDPSAETIVIVPQLAGGR